MKNDTKERMAFVAGSLIELADMAESDLQDLFEIVGVDALQKLMDITRFHCDMSYEEMAEEVCNVTGWEPMLVIPARADEELSKMGRQIAGLVEDTNPIDEDAAECLHAVLCWDGIEAWLAANSE